MAMIGTNGGLIGSPRSSNTYTAPGLWTPYEQVLLHRAGLWPLSGDPLFAYNSLLLHMDGTNGSTTFTDSSSNARTVTPFGNAQISTAQNKFGGASGLFDGTGDYLTVSDLTIGGGDWTIEFWIYLVTAPTGSFRAVCSQGTTDVSTSLMIYINTSNQLVFYSSGSIATTPVSAVAVNQWAHIAVVSRNSTATIYIDGVSRAANSYSARAFTSASFQVDRGYGGITEGVNAYIDDFRVTKGVARYTANFALPTAPFLDAGLGGYSYYATTNLLLHMDGSNGSTTFTDSSSKAITITANGNAQISTAQSKFGGASAAFDGTGDWLAATTSSDLSFGTGDFTIEMFVYFNAVGQRALYDTEPAGSSGTRSAGFVWYLNTSNKLQLFSAASDRGASVTTLATSTWYHIALVRSLGVFSYFIDGVKDATTFTLATNYTGTAPLLGRFCDNTSNMLNGYIDELRVTKGVALYTGNFTPPTAAFPDN